MQLGQISSPLCKSPAILIALPYGIACSEGNLESQVKEEKTARQKCPENVFHGFQVLIDLCKKSMVPKMCCTLRPFFLTIGEVLKMCFIFVQLEEVKRAVSPQNVFH